MHYVRLSVILLATNTTGLHVQLRYSLVIDEQEVNKQTTEKKKKTTIGLQGKEVVTEANQKSEDTTRPGIRTKRSSQRSKSLCPTWNSNIQFPLVTN